MLQGFHSLDSPAIKHSQGLPVLTLASFPFKYLVVLGVTFCDLQSIEKKTGEIKIRQKQIKPTNNKMDFRCSTFLQFCSTKRKTAFWAKVKSIPLDTD